MLSYPRCFAPGPRFKNPKLSHYYSLPAEKTHYFTADSTSDNPSLSHCLHVFKDNRSVAANPNYTAVLSKLWEKSLEAMRKPATAAVLLGLLVMYNPNSAALATPVGRVGGSFTSCLTSYTTTSHNPSDNSSTRIKMYDIGYYDPLWDWILGGVLATYVVGGMIIVILTVDKKFVFGASLILWTAIMAIWFHSLGQTSVVKLQLQCNLSNTARALQMDLNRIAEAANPHTHEGLRYVVRDTAIAILRQPDDCISGYSSVVISKFGRAAAQQCFNKLAVREKIRYDKETMVNLDNIKSQSMASQRYTDESHNDDIVVTILLAAEGKSKSLTITDSSDVIRVLEELASIDPSKRGVEVLWSIPQLSSKVRMQEASNYTN
ncbi:uncharacterized protein LOC126792354 [Argentina anserina]|uniref:uncharacterized protein LOC126792354 n=1 Tax=Argentina anserina TaxID=57926 RepID=UPI0021765D91|nr:uncharacterized protein LOC126792354 [Potentilla anserina]